MRWRDREIGLWCLGTAQLGFDYGISNTHGQPSLPQAQEIVAAAFESGVRLFDTATAYGGSHKVLGECLQALGKTEDALIITKFGDAELQSERAGELTKDALVHTRAKRFFGLLAHSQESLKQADLCRKTFVELKNQGLIESGGVSVYDAKDALRALTMDEFDIVQMPLNVLDRAALTSEVIQAAREANKLLLFRSAFLQGLLTMDAQSLPTEMDFAESLLREWLDVCTHEGIAPKRLALQIAAEMAGGFPLVIGAELATQVKENADTLASASPDVRRIVAETAALAARTPETLRNPSLWPKVSTANK